MPANTAPIFSEVPAVAWGTVTAANTAKDGTGTLATIFTAGVEGSYVQKVIAQPLGTNVASVARIFLNNGLTNGTAANNTMIGQIGLAATTNTEIAALTGAELNLNIAIPAGHRIMVALGTAVSAGWAFTAVGGDY
jgi:hypothetical protein